MSTWGASDEWGGSSWGIDTPITTSAWPDDKDSKAGWGDLGIKLETQSSAQTAVKPQVRILKRADSPASDSSKSLAGAAKRETFEAREQRYLQARQKIFGANDRSPTNSPEPYNKNSKKTLAGKKTHQAGQGGSQKQSFGGDHE